MIGLMPLPEEWDPYSRSSLVIKVSSFQCVILFTQFPSEPSHQVLMQQKGPREDLNLGSHIFQNCEQF